MTTPLTRLSSEGSLTTIKLWLAFSLSLASYCWPSLALLHSVSVAAVVLAAEEAARRSRRLADLSRPIKPWGAYMRVWRTLSVRAPLAI